MKFFLVLVFTLSTAFANNYSDYDKISFRPTKSGFDILLVYQELLGIKAFLHAPTNVDFKTIVTCESLSGYTFANISLQRDYLFINPERSRFRGGELTTSYSSIRIKTHKLCDGQLVDVITVNGKKVPKFGFKKNYLTY